MLEQLGLTAAAKEVVLSVLIVALSLLVAKGVDLLIRWVGRHVTSRTRTELDDALIGAIKRPMFYAVVLIGFYIAAHRLALTPEVKGSTLKVVDSILFTLAIIVGASILWRVSGTFIRWYTHTVAVRTATRFDDEFAPLIGRIVKALIFFVAAIVILDYFGINVNSLVVSLGVGSLAIALAAKDTLANMIAGVVIMIDRPFRIGDRILLSSGEKGDVYDIGLRSTKILTFDNTLIVMPNAQIINEKLTNLSYPDPKIRVRVDVGVAYGTDLEKAKNIMIDVCREHPDVLDDPEPQCWFIDFGDSSLNLSVRCRVANYGQQWRVGEELRMRINRRFEEEGIEIPFPQRVVHFKK
ncbi:MAG: mechanosensitive ion channel family protein [bacterium]